MARPPSRGPLKHAHTSNAASACTLTYYLLLLHMHTYSMCSCCTCATTHHVQQRMRTQAGVRFHLLREEVHHFQNGLCCLMTGRAFNSFGLKNVPLPDEVKTVKEAALWVGESYTHGNRNPHAAWKSMAGGQSYWRRWRCNAHVDCPVIVIARMPREPSSRVQVWVKDVEHTAVEEEYDRTNAALDRVQKKAFLAAKRWGATSKEVMQKEQEDCVLSAKRRKQALTLEEACEGAIYCICTAFILHLF